MKERPILFSGDMVRAILDGRKTQTRRVIKFEQLSDVRKGRLFYSMTFNGWAIEGGDVNIELVECPYGVPGDRLWVREGYYRPTDFWIPGRNWKRGGQTQIRYTANGDVVSHEITHEQYDKIHKQKSGKHPGRHLFKFLSRIRLEVISVRVKRVQDISNQDALHEGVGGDTAKCHSNYCDHKQKFGELWDSINTKRGYGWNSNPWVWVVEFKIAR